MRFEIYARSVHCTLQ